MSRRSALATLVGACALAACGGGGGDDKSIPTSGPYVSAQYTTDQLSVSYDIEYGRRPNAGGQSTSTLTSATEVGQSELVLTLDIAVPPNASASQRQPLLVWIHGGNFEGGDKSDGYGELSSYARAGYVAATVNYRLTPNNQSSSAARVEAIRQASEDGMNAIRFLLANAAAYGIDPTRVFTLGISAGGGISLFNAVEFDGFSNSVSDRPGVSSRVAAAISTGATLVSNDFDADALVDYQATDTPMLLFHTDPIDPVTAATWVGNVLPTQQRVNAAGSSCIVVAQPAGVHVVDLSLGGPYWNDHIRPFLWQRLRLAALR